MHLIDTFGAVAGRFVRGVLGVSPPTLLGADWPNAVQDEIVAVIEAAGIELDKGDNGQLLQALKKLARPIGKYNEYALPGVWDNNLEKEPQGQVLLRADYPELWALVSAPGAAAHLAVDAAEKLAKPWKWGKGDGATTFEMPDERGLFHRIRDPRVGAKAPAPGEMKPNQNKRHDHGATLGTGVGGDSDQQFSTYGGASGTTTARVDFDVPFGQGDEANPDHIVTYYTIVLK